MNIPSRDELGQILKRSQRIAVVGLSRSSYKTSHMIAEAMQAAGYTIIPVNPHVDTVLGLKCYRSLKDIPFHVDIVNVFRPSEDLVKVAHEFVEIDADVFWAQSGCISEEAYHFLHEKGYTVVMDRCIKVEHALTK